MSWYQADPADLREFRVQKDDFSVCCTGRNTPSEGFDGLIRAMEELSSDVKVHLLLVGDVDKNEVIRALAAQSPASDRIHFTGFRTDAPSLAAASDIFVLPSKEREGLPRAVIESMVYGVAPVVTRVGGMPELVENGVSGLVVPPSNSSELAGAIERLYRDNEFRAKLGQAARERIAGQFHTSETVRETGELYKSLVGRS